MEQGKVQEILRLAKERGIIRPRDLEGEGISGTYLAGLARQGLLMQLGRGLYQLPDYDLSIHHSLAEAAKRVPQGVICLLSALRFHELTTQAPFEVWMAIAHKARRPDLDSPPLRVIYMSKETLQIGIEEHVIEGVPVRVHNPAKTVADCFKFRNKIGLDVALEALRDYLRTHPSGMSDLWKYAEIDRVANVMKPYLEASA